MGEIGIDKEDLLEGGIVVKPVRTLFRHQGHRRSLIRKIQISFGFARNEEPLGTRIVDEIRVFAGTTPLDHLIWSVRTTGVSFSVYDHWILETLTTWSIVAEIGLKHEMTSVHEMKFKTHERRSLEKSACGKSNWLMSVAWISLRVDSGQHRASTRRINHETSILITTEENIGVWRCPCYLYKIAVLFFIMTWYTRNSVTRLCNLLYFSKEEKKEEIY